jgi:hypothetical protein
MKTELQIILTKRIDESVSAITWGQAKEGNKASAKKFAKENGWMIHILSPSDRGEVIRPAISYHVWEEERLTQERFEEILASQERMEEDNVVEG